MERSPRTIYLIWRASAKIMNLIDNPASGTGLSLLKYVVLSFVKGRQGMTSADLARRIGVSPQSMNQTVTAMENAGLLRKGREKTNLKSRPLELTEDGLAILDRADEAIDDIEKTVLGDLSGDELVQFRTWIGDIIASSRKQLGDIG